MYAVVQLHAVGRTVTRLRRGLLACSVSRTRRKTLTVVTCIGLRLKAPRILSSAARHNRATNVTIPYPRVTPADELCNKGRLSPGDGRRGLHREVPVRQDQRGVRKASGPIN